ALLQLLDIRARAESFFTRARYDERSRHGSGHLVEGGTDIFDQREAQSVECFGPVQSDYREFLGKSELDGHHALTFFGVQRTGAGLMRPAFTHSTNSRLRILQLAVIGNSLMQMKYSGMSNLESPSLARCASISSAFTSS